MLGGAFFQAKKSWVYEKIAWAGEYGVSSSFNVAHMTPFVAGDDFEHLRANAFQEGGNDESISENESIHEREMVTVYHSM